MIMAIDGKTLGGQRSGYVVVSAEVLAHAMNKHDDARTRLAPISSPAIADKLPAVRGTVRRVVGSQRPPAKPVA